MSLVPVFGVRMSTVVCLGLSLLSAPALAQGNFGLGWPNQNSQGQDSQNQTFGIDNDLLGKLGGAAVGALVGSQIGKGTGNLLAIGAGGLLGYFAGGYLMDQLSPGSRDAVHTAESRALDAPVGQTIRWNSPDSSTTRGSITPIRAGRDQQGRECKEFQHKVFIDGRQETANGTTCRGEDGQWKLVAQQ